MKYTGLSRALALVLLLASIVIAASPRRAAALTKCSAEAIYAKCDIGVGSAAKPSGGKPINTQATSVVQDCGPQLSAMTPPSAFASDSLCDSYLWVCRSSPGIPFDPTLHTEFTTYRAPTTGDVVKIDMACSVRVAPALPSVAAIRAEAVRRAPQLRAATGGSDYLINAAVVFYLTPPAGTPTADTTGAAGDPGEVTIPPFTLAGHTFTIQLHLTSTDWDWGDGTTTSYTIHPAGQPYRPDQPCATLTDCPGYVAHTYSQPGRYTATATAHWSAGYTLDGNPQPVPIPGELTTTSTPRTITTRQAHAELVAQ